ncbi:hypothetical protein OAO87_01305 [bacterium]|nr:hypothetical protein [bacterium]
MHGDCSAAAEQHCTLATGSAQVGEAERNSLFNRVERSVWWLPRKPTLLYMYDVIARSQLLSAPKAWWVCVPSGHWRVVWGYMLLVRRCKALVVAAATDRRPTRVPTAPVGSRCCACGERQGAACADVVLCTWSLAACSAPFAGWQLWLLQALFLVDVAVKVRSAQLSSAQLRSGQLSSAQLRSGQVSSEAAAP